MTGGELRSLWRVGGVFWVGVGLAALTVGCAGPEVGVTGGPSGSVPPAPGVEARAVSGCVQPGGMVEIARTLPASLEYHGDLYMVGVVRTRGGAPIRWVRRPHHVPVQTKDFEWEVLSREPEPPEAWLPLGVEYESVRFVAPADMGTGEFEFLWPMRPHAQVDEPADYHLEARFRISPDCEPQGSA